MNKIERARKNGWLVYELRQGWTAPLQQPGPWGIVAGNGYCAALTCRWLQLKCAGKDYPTGNANGMIVGLPDGMGELSKTQNVYYDEAIEHGHDDGFRRMMARHNLLFRDDDVRRFAPVTGALLAANVKNKGFYYVSLKNAKSGHGIGILKGGGAALVFDPNIGLMNSFGAGVDAELTLMRILMLIMSGNEYRSARLIPLLRLGTGDGW
jgi:hypothetical protein